MFNEIPVLYSQICRLSWGFYCWFLQISMQICGLGYLRIILWMQTTSALVGINVYHVEFNKKFYTWYRIISNKMESNWMWTISNSSQPGFKNSVECVLINSWVQINNKHWIFVITAHAWLWEKLWTRYESSRLVSGRKVITRYNAFQLKTALTEWLWSIRKNKCWRLHACRQQQLHS